MFLSDVGDIAEQIWNEIPDHFQVVELGQFVIMPDHMHGILHHKNYTDKVLDQFVKEMNITGRTELATGRFQNPQSDSLTTIIGTFKAAVSRRCRVEELEVSWQPRFSDVSIQNKDELRFFENYIKENPKRWRA